MIPLTEIPLPLNRGKYLALYAAGCATADDVKCQDFEQLTACVGATVASLLKPAESTQPGMGGGASL